jgi:fermentation-respiration switch protein FrsA (DUF1100 family)
MINARSLGLCLASLGVASAQTPAAAGNSQADWARLAQGALGADGGNNLFYFPTRDEPSTPASWGLKYEAVDFKSKDGTPLHGWLMKAKNETLQSAKGTIVFSHGNAGSMSYHLGFCVWMAEAGYNVLLYDYRGFGKSGGSVGRRGMIDDVKAAFHYALSRNDIDRTKLVSFGHSLGGAQSVTALGEAPVKGLRAIVIDGAFASYRAMARAIGGQLGESVVTDDLAPKDFVAKLAPVPFLVVHGERDEVVPFAQGHELYEKARQPKTLFDVAGGRHGTSLTENHDEYRKKVIAWLDGVLNG